MEYKCSLAGHTQVVQEPVYISRINAVYKCISYTALPFKEMGYFDICYVKHSKYWLCCMVFNFSLNHEIIFYLVTQKIAKKNTKTSQILHKQIRKLQKFGGTLSGYKLVVSQTQGHVAWVPKPTHRFDYLLGGIQDSVYRPARSGL